VLALPREYWPCPESAGRTVWLLNEKQRYKNVVYCGMISHLVCHRYRLMVLPPCFSVTELHSGVPLPLNSNLDVFEIGVSEKGTGDVVSLGPVRQGHIRKV
jgi:hypothetical protein